MCFSEMVPIRLRAVKPFLLRTELFLTIIDGCFHNSILPAFLPLVMDFICWILISLRLGKYTKSLIRKVVHLHKIDLL